MESILPIIIGLVIIIIKIMNSDKKKEAARKQAMRQNRPVQEVQNPFEEWLKSLNPQEETVIEEVEEEEVELEQTLYPSYREQLVEVGNVQSAIPTVETTLCAINDNQSEEEKIAFAEPTKAKNKLIDENFDIKKAIIFSEIFAPKYE